jgi:hypothetical protein
MCCKEVRSWSGEAEIQTEFRKRTLQRATTRNNELGGKCRNWPWETRNVNEVR